MFTVLPGDRFQERGARGRIFRVVARHAYGLAMCEFDGGSKRRGEETRTVEICTDTLRKRFVLIGAGKAGGA